MAGDGQEKTEEASAKRKADARKEGRVAKSQDMVGAVVSIMLVACLPSLIGTIGSGFVTSVRSSYVSIPTDFSRGNLLRAFSMALLPSAPGLLFLLLSIIGVSVLATVIQTGFNFSTKSLVPSFSKIDPMQGVKRMFSPRALMEGGKAFAKFLLFGWIAYSSISANWGMIAGLSQLRGPIGLVFIASTIRSIAIKVAFVWFVLAAIDYYFQRKQNDKQMKMTKDEVKREMKDSDGSPEIKGARMQRRRKMMKQRVRDAVRTADVIVTNPTHFAVALKYDASKNSAPIVVAKGADHLATKIREFAKEDRIPIVPNPRLARALYKQCEVGDPIPRELFAAVAELLAYVYKVLKHVKKA